MQNKEIVKYVDAWRDSILSIYSDNHQDMFIKSAKMLLTESDDLKECFQTEKGRISIHNALVRAAGVGLSLNPQDKKACIIVYNKKIKGVWHKIANYQVMKEGLIDLVMQTGQALSFKCDYVREKDQWEEIGSSRGDEYKHIRARKNRGEIEGYYAACVMKSGLAHVLYMTCDEIVEHRSKYARGWTYADGPNKGQPNPLSIWVKSFHEMGLKTVSKLLSYRLRISSELDKTLDNENTLVVDAEPAYIEGGPATSDDLTKVLQPAEEFNEETGEVIEEKGEESKEEKGEKEKEKKEEKGKNKKDKSSQKKLSDTY